MQTISGLKKLRRKLPHQYSVLIAEKMGGINPRRIHSVFYGKTKNSEFVLKVIAAAEQVLKDQKAVEQEIKKLTASK